MHVHAPCRQIPTHKGENTYIYIYILPTERMITMITRAPRGASPHRVAMSLSEQAIKAIQLTSRSELYTYHQARSSCVSLRDSTCIICNRACRAASTRGVLITHTINSMVIRENKFLNTSAYVHAARPEGQVRCQRVSAASSQVATFLALAHPPTPLVSADLLPGSGETRMTW